MGVMESGGASPYPQTATPQSGLENNIPHAQRKRKICVYCGSSAGKKPEHLEAARQLAKVMADNDIGLGESALESHTSFSSFRYFICCPQVKKRNREDET